MAKTKYPPSKEPKLRSSVPRKVMRQAVQKLVALQKSDAAAYLALVEKDKGAIIPIVPG